MPIWGELELLCRAIAEEGRKGADEILARAREEARRTVAEAKERVRHDFERDLHSKLGLAHAEAKRIVDSAELESRKRLLSFREQVMREVLNALGERLNQFREEPDYPDFLARALQEGIEQLPGSELVVELSADDLERFRERLLETLCDRQLNVEMRSSGLLDWGLRVYTADRRLLFDNSLSARLKRMEGVIRQEIWREILGSE
mgnify:CR=1 FL=1